MTENHRAYCRINYWRREGNCTTSRAKDEDWTHCEVAPISSYSSYGTQTFSQDYIARLPALLHLLAQAFDAGRRSKASEIKRALEI